MSEMSGYMAGKRGLIMGVANDKSIAWGIAQACHEAGAEIAYTYQGEALGKRVKPLAAQTGSDSQLKLMNRGYTIGEYDEFIERARAILHEPEKGRPLSLSGDIIVGFPTETDEDFAKTVDLVRRSRYKNCFIFKYSPRPGTVAYDKIPDDVPDDVKRRRNNELLAVQAEISGEVGREQVGGVFDVFVEGLSKKTLKAGGMTKGQLRRADAVTLTVSASASSEPTAVADGDEMVQLSGRTDGDLIVFFEAPAREAESLVGTIKPVRITDAERHSLFGERV